ncbi:GNAT family N-acetyltransferase [Shewanella sp. D64]|uniref:GNAT family N-acetyltransferase n=1 Tax=unclassified Shewanella TaxID=196818 RepID=UPI0022BA3AC2|nr:MULTISPECIES: GNAT family N-acetyltransferase [unclassified Shewanella]MEC4726276.1 GNAT family N-acetyltransferase [Shewanella sp. D64]MEC4738288.1 GNAT family N-acetyltransferase [Shewanella sp. E94]WBJ95425.1 GNAT family N-acetyltransferase [Shewanella sp. MTB7]
MQRYRISNELNEMDIDVIHAFISKSYWAKDIPKSVLQKALVHSLCFGVFTNDKQQIGFGRLITDRATYAYLADVFIIDEYRGLGLGKALMTNIVSHPDLQGLRRMVLSTRDAHGLYAKFGFKPVPNPEVFMQVWQPDVYNVSE